MAGTILQGCPVKLGSCSDLVLIQQLTDSRNLHLMPIDGLLRPLKCVVTHMTCAQLMIKLETWFFWLTVYKYEVARRGVPCSFLCHTYVST